MLRESPLFQFKHGDHVCIFYHSEDALLELLTPYFAEGLRQGERCFGVQTSRVLKRLFNELRFLGIDSEEEAKRGALVLHTDDKGYATSGGKFDPEQMIDTLVRTIEDSGRQGFSGFRSAGDLTWAARELQECNRVIGYEEMVEKTYPGKPALGFCQYRVQDFEPSVLDAVLAMHKMHMLESRESFCSSLSLGYNSHSAEIVASRSEESPNFNYVVQNCKSHDFVGWGTAPDFQTANRHVHELITPPS